MTTIQFQTILKYETDTDTGKTRLISAWTKMLGKGTNTKKPKKERKLTSNVEYEEM